MKKTLTCSLLLAATSLISAPASAAVVSLQETGLGNGLMTGGLVLPIDTRTLDYWAGTQTVLINGKRTELAFCVDPWEWSSSQNQSYATGSLTAVFGTAKAGMIGELYSEAYRGTLLSTSQGDLNAAAFQLALWEIIADDNPALAGLQANLNSGLVRVVGGTNASLVAATNALLSRIDGVYGADNYVFDYYASGRSAGQAGTAGYQDFLVAHQVPEPGVISLVISALSVLSGIALFGGRRRKQKD